MLSGLVSMSLRHPLNEIARQTKTRPSALVLLFLYCFAVTPPLGTTGAGGALLGAVGGTWRSARTTATVAVNTSFLGSSFSQSLRPKRWFFTGQSRAVTTSCHRLKPRGCRRGPALYSKKLVPSPQGQPKSSVRVFAQVSPSDTASR